MQFSALGVNEHDDLNSTMHEFIFNSSILGILAHIDNLLAKSLSQNILFFG